MGGAGAGGGFWAILFLSFIHLISSYTYPDDVTALKALRAQWENTPPSWGKSNDPCGASWDGITCNSNSRVTALSLSSMGLKGSLPGDIGGLTELLSLELPQNPDLTGPLTPRLGDLTKLTFLVLAQCGFTGTIPDELGNLADLTFLALNSNKLTGQIPSSLGKLSKVNWLDLADNLLTGPIPVSSITSSSGLDLLLEARHFHFNNNNLSSSIPPTLFSSGMTLIHVLFDGNKLTGEIPSSLGLVKTLEVLRLDRNLLTGNVSTNLNNLTNVNELNLANNQLSGPFPDLTGMNSLSYVDLSNNSFAQSEVPTWFTTIQSLTTLVVEYGPLKGALPQELFTFPVLQQVKMRNNAFDGTLVLGDSIGQALQLVDLENNNISSATLGSSYKNSLILVGNPVCNGSLSNTVYCQIQQSNTVTYSTSTASCGSKTSCPIDQKLNPKSCECAYPYEGTLTFRAPSFRELSDATRFESLETSLWEKLNLPSGYVSLQNPFFNSNDYLQVYVALFPPTGKYFTRSQVLRIGGDLTNQAYKPPDDFGPYVFNAIVYPFPDHNSASISVGAIVAIAVCCTFLVLGLIGVGVYAFRQKKRAEKAIELSKPFASWAPGGKDSGGAPQLKGARWFSYDELKKCTNGFSEGSEIGSGGYGRVYRGTLTNGHVVAIKRAQQGSMQGGAEFRNEIELLSRVHHKNLVSLVGFCFEQGEQMLVYEFMPNGTLGESLSGKTGIYLDWSRRLQLALGSARGITYLHELADPPIIHRDIKTANILLDENLTAKVADFGLSKLIADTEKGHVSTQVKGTLGYLDPEYYMTQQLTDKSDVYSFGIVMLELITAKLPIQKGKYIVREVKMAMDITDDEFLGMKSIIDPAIKNSTNLPGFAKFLKLAMSCVEESADERPTMREVVKDIEKMLELDGLNTNSNSAASSATDFLNGKSGTPPKHPYSNDALPKRDITDSSDGFEYSGGYSYSTDVVPK